MLQGFRVFDADAHGSINPRMWEHLPEQYRARRPRPVAIHDGDGLGNFNAGWLIEGSLEPHALGPGAQQANTPRNVLAEFGATTEREHCSIGSMTLNDPQARLRDMDRMGLDAQMLFPSTLYAHMTARPWIRSGALSRLQSLPRRAVPASAEASYVVGPPALARSASGL